MAVTRLTTQKATGMFRPPQSEVVTMQHAFQRPAASNPEALTELGRFFALSVELNQPLTMFSEYIDDAWHSLMEEPERYREFCIDVVGRAVGHNPSGANNPMVDVEWLPEYEAKYGRLPASWFADIDGNVDDQLYQTYIKTGEIRASWACNPSTGTSDGAP